MSERTRNEKTAAQDVIGVLFCLVGGFFAVSIVLFLRGNVPQGGALGSFTGLVVELVTLLGPAVALVFSLGLASLGTVLFLRPAALGAGRLLAALVAVALAFAVFAGAFTYGGELGGFLPAHVAGALGRVLAGVLGLALAWFAWTLLPVARGPRTSSAEAFQRIGLASRSDAAGVSPAEAALLVTDTRTSTPRPAPRREEVHPIREETLRPHAPVRPLAPAPKPRSESPATPIIAPAAARPLGGATAPVAAESAPPAPSWEELAPAPTAGEEEPLDFDEADFDEEEEFDTAGPSAAARALDAADNDEDSFVALAAALDAVEIPLVEHAEDDEAEEADEAEEELEGVEEESEEPMAAASAEPGPPKASWEQVGLFDEEEELEEEAPAATPAKVELTPTFDFDSALPSAPSHEPEIALEETAVAPRVIERPALRSVEDEPEAAPEPARADRGVLQPTPPQPARPEPVTVAADDGGEHWSRLVFDAGCAILEQKRVAVSMLERRFGVDFDQACRVLDELQQAGLIGPYMGGRARDILLTREEWLAHAPQAS